MPDPSYIESTFTASFTGTLPGSLAEGDLMFFLVVGRGTSSLNPTISGWNLVATDVGDIPATTTDVCAALWWRRATASETAPTATATGSLDTIRNVMSIWRDAPDPVDTNHLAHDGTTSPLALPEVAVAGRTMVVAFIGSQTTISGWGGDGFTQSYRFNAGSPGVALAEAYRLFDYEAWYNPELITLGGVFFTVALRIRTDAGIYVDGAVH